jgi:hypothetical protein
MNAKLETKWKEAVLIYFKEPSQYLPAATYKNHEKSVRIAKFAVEWLSLFFRIRQAPASNLGPETG